MHVTTRGDGKPNKSCCDRRALAETKTGGTSNFKEDNVATSNRGRDIYSKIGQNNQVAARNRKIE